MKIEEVIKRLQEIAVEHPGVDCKAWYDDYESGPVYSVEYQEHDGDEWVMIGY